jgi:hypothetical protein
VEYKREMKFRVGPVAESKEGDASGSSTFIFESFRPPLHPTSYWKHAIVISWGKNGDMLMMETEVKSSMRQFYPLLPLRTISFDDLKF